MPRKKSYITVTDQFCGAGGSSQGVRRFAERTNGGIEVKLALNHWKLAIDTHNTNFPDTLHDCTDISACDPRRYHSTDILITSPECTNHSLAKGVKIAKKQMDLFNSGKIDPAAERSRATMWDVCRFAECHSYNIIIVENVVDARKWVQWDAWLYAMRLLGYEHRCVYINSMHCHPTPQSRDRMYVVFWKKKNKAPMLDYMPAAYCNKCGKNVNAIQTWKNTQKRFGKYRQQYVYCCPADGAVVEPYYYAAFNCIDFSDKGTRIGDRPLKKYYDKTGELLKYKGESMLPLAPNSMIRVDIGLDKFGAQCFQVQTVNGKEHKHRTKLLYDSSFTHTTLQSQAIVNPPFIFNQSHTLQKGYTNNSLDKGDTQCTQQRNAIVFQPFIIEMNRTGSAKAITEPTSTFTGGGINHSIVNMPFIVENKGESDARAITEAAACQTQKQYLGLITNDSWNSFISHVYGNGYVKQITEALGSVRTKHGHELVLYKKPNINECYYRMLKPHEIQLAMAFEEDYIVLGSGKDKVKQLGNAVTPPAMEWLIQQCIASLS